MRRQLGKRVQIGNGGGLAQAAARIERKEANPGAYLPGEVHVGQAEFASGVQEGAAQRMAGRGLDGDPFEDARVGGGECLRVPACGAKRFPQIEVGVGRTDECAVIVVGAATQKPCARIAQFRGPAAKGRGSEAPVVVGGLFVEAVEIGGCRVTLIRLSGFEENDPATRPLREALRDDASGRAAADDEKVTRFGHARATLRS